MGKKNDEQKPTPTAGDEPLAEGALVEAGDLSPISEAAQIIVPKKGKLLEERKIAGGHTVRVAKFAIIRPCQSRGKSIRGYQPIYEAKMLAEHASVFTGWQMYLDHVTEGLAEALEEMLQEKGRSWKELGGRVLKSWFDPTVSLAEDEEYGFQKGAVVGEIIPYPVVREVLEADPLGLAVSINAWPTAARIGRPSWDKSKKGAVIEGIRSKPKGSVDFVPAAGAGGRFLTESSSPEEVRSAVSLLESGYAAARADDHDEEERPVPVKKLSEMSADEVAALTQEQLHEALRQENPSLAESLTAAPAAPAREGDEAKPITQADLDRALTEQREALTEEFSDARESAEDLAEAIVQEREGQRGLAAHAAKKLAEVERNGLPKEYVEQIGRNYEMTVEGARPGIVVTEQDLPDEDGNVRTAQQVVEARLTEDVADAVRLIKAAGGNPRIKGLAPSGKTEEGEEKPAESRKQLREGSAFMDFLSESGDLTGDPEKDDKRIREMVEG